MTLMRQLTLTVVTLGTILCPLAFAQTTKPSNATGQCKDGTYSTASSKSGACRGHNGVKEWYTATAATPSAPAAAGKAPAPTSQAAAPAPKAATPAPAPIQAAAKPQPAKGPKANLATTPAAAGGAPNLVWVNTSSNVYHCYGTDFYGKTKAGSYMTEADAKAKNARPDHGKTCGK